MTTLLLPHPMADRRCHGNPGVTWRFRVLYERYLDILTEDRLMYYDDDENRAIQRKALGTLKTKECILKNAKTTLPHGTNKYPNATRGAYTSAGSLHVSTPSITSKSGVSYDSSSSISTSITETKSFSTQSSPHDNVSVLIPKSHTHHHKVTIEELEEEILPSY